MVTPLYSPGEVSSDSVATIRRRGSSARIPIIDVLKAVASQLIVWHHLAFYGPMSDVVYPHATGLIDWLYAKARIAVQVFLAVGGFLAAGALFPQFESGRPSIPRLVWRRYVRLAVPYLFAIIAAILAGAFARAMMPHPANPSEPSLGQVIAHIFLLQDVVGEEALSAGVWYVAIDFQLYVLLALLLWSAKWIATATSVRMQPAGIAGCTMLAGASLFWLNLNRGLDEWAPYFFGAYGLGVLAQRVSVSHHRFRWTAVMAAFAALALVVRWRDRIFIAAVTAVLLASATDFAPRWATSRVVRALARISYSVFLIHYPVCLTVNAIVFRLWPERALPNAVGMAVAWLLSLLAGALLHQFAERRTTRAGGDFAPDSAGCAGSTVVR